ncbi:hypothetical protein [Nonomuraea sp. NPDC005501]|uniref:hypothetical protein n=1 Tax=Nonomuraea sp. NPDC005501 TaxID=3156884 RepID=UPI0033AB088B
MAGGRSRSPPRPGSRTGSSRPTPPPPSATASSTISPSRSPRGQVAELPPGHPDRPARLFQHAQALLWRFEAHAERADLEQAVALGREAVATVTADPARARARTVLAQAMRTRFQLSGDLDDIDESARLAREGHELAEPGSVEEIATLSHLDAALLLKTGRWNAVNHGPGGDQPSRLGPGAGVEVVPDHHQRSPSCW